jgi:hypothetical protein
MVINSKLDLCPTSHMGETFPHMSAGCTPLWVLTSTSNSIHLKQVSSSLPLCHILLTYSLFTLVALISSVSTAINLKMNKVSFRWNCMSFAFNEMLHPRTALFPQFILLFLFLLSPSPAQLQIIILLTTLTVFKSFFSSILLHKFLSHATSPHPNGHAVGIDSTG